MKIDDRSRHEAASFQNGVRATVARRLGRGAVAGAAATGAMSGIMLLAKATRPGVRPAPEVITDAALAAAGGASAGIEKAATVGAHFAFGTANGALFSLLAARLPGPAVAKGILFGVALLTVSYQGWIPQVGILPPLDKQRPHRLRTLVAAHLVYGSVLGWVGTNRRGRRQRPAAPLSFR